MGEKKVTIMVLKVDLQCEKCYKKVKKVLCKFPQIRDQTYDEKNNQVIIKVVCCSPEKIRDKLCCKGGGAIKSIDILPPEKPKPKEPEKPKEKPKEPAKPKEAEKPKEEPKKKPMEAVDPKKPPREIERPKDQPEPKKAEKPKEEPPVLFLVPAYPPVTGSACCMDCDGGHPGGPCQAGYGYGGPAPYIQYDGYYGRPVYDSYGVTRPDCFSEENPQACAIM